MLTPTLLGGGYCSQAKDFFSRLSNQPGSTRKAQYNALIASLVLSGVWAKLDALYVFAAADSATALTNLVQSSYGATAVNSPTFTTDQGYTGASTKYINSNFNPVTASAPKFVQDSASLGAWSLSSQQITGAIAGGLVGTNLYIEQRWNDNFAYARCNDLKPTALAASTDGSGFFTITRNGTVDCILYRNGTSFAVSNYASNALSSGNIAFLNGEGGVAYWAAGTCAAGVIGSGLSGSENASLYNALHLYLQTVAGVA